MACHVHDIKKDEKKLTRTARERERERDRERGDREKEKGKRESEKEKEREREEEAEEGKCDIEKQDSKGMIEVNIGDSHSEVNIGDSHSAGFQLQGEENAVVGMAEEAKEETEEEEEVEAEEETEEEPIRQSQAAADPFEKETQMAKKGGAEEGRQGEVSCKRRLDLGVSRQGEETEGPRDFDLTCYQLLVCIG